MNKSRRAVHFVIPIVAGIGNALLAVPMVRQLRGGFGGSKITIVARTQPMADVFERVEEVSEVIKMGSGSVGMGWSMRVAPRPDVCIIPFPSNRWQYMMLAFASGARRRIMHSYPVGYFQTLGFLPAERLPAVQGIHDVVQNLYLLRMLGIEPDISREPDFPVRDFELEKARGVLESIAIDSASRPIILHAGSARTVLAAAKRWSPQHYAALIAEIPTVFKNPVVLVEGPDEIGVSDEIMRQCLGFKPAVLQLSGPLAFSAGVLNLASIYIGSDSGLAHLAAAVGTPPVTLFAPSDPERCSPFGYRDLVVQPRGKTCCPCFRYPFMATKPAHGCVPPYCINEIKVEDVLEAAGRAMMMRETGVLENRN